ncbi:unnamed protein product [Meloidogyne enterolobii]|uniref:Uncharacterized protein n=1 Tax=Meloidogyne enterolobii TaxID=390850 RepID=A0ACB0XNF9_MELEN
MLLLFFITWMGFLLHVPLLVHCSKKMRKREKKLRKKQKKQEKKARKRMMAQNNMGMQGGEYPPPAGVAPGASVGWQQIDSGGGGGFVENKPMKPVKQQQQHGPCALCCLGCLHACASLSFSSLSISSSSSSSS